MASIVEKDEGRLIVLGPGLYLLKDFSHITLRRLRFHDNVFLFGAQPVAALLDAVQVVLLTVLPILNVLILGDSGNSTVVRVACNRPDELGRLKSIGLDYLRR